MSGLGIFGLISGLLQLTVPSYSFRLVRRFGTHRVGWFIVVAFSSLALLHLLRPLKAMNSGPQGMLDLFYAIAALFLVIGFGHIETLCSQQHQTSRDEERLRSKLESETREKTADLAEANQKLILEIARREHSENALKASEAQYRLLFAQNPQPMWILDLRSLRPLAVNEAALLQYGYGSHEFMTLTARDLLSRAAADGFTQDLARPCSSAQFRGTWEHCRKDGTPIYVEITALDLWYGACPARLMVANDVSPRRQREQERCEVQQRQLVGRLAGGVAHHLNNILSIISGHASLLLAQSQDRKAAEHLDHISSAVNRATALSRQLLMVGGRHATLCEPFALNGLIQSLDPMLRRIVGDKAGLLYALDALLPPIFADACMIEHVLVNLVLNARDAMSKRGSIAISTAKVWIQDIPPQCGEGVKPGNFVRLAVRDNGCGMTPEVQARLFEPFFTTRDIGMGTGLGLSSSNGAIRELSGWIEFTSNAGAGSEFRVFVPCATAPQKEVPTTVPAAKETILLVEPDDRVRALARFILNRQGYRVIEADSGPTVLALWEGQGTKVALLFTDTVLPGGISGRDLAGQLCRSKPSLKVVYTSGSGDNQDGIELIPKPYTPDKLLSVLQASLAKSC